MGKPVGRAAVEDSGDGPQRAADGARRGDKDMAACKPDVPRLVDAHTLVAKDSGV